MVGYQGGLGGSVWRGGRGDEMYLLIGVLVLLVMLVIISDVGR